MIDLASLVNHQVRLAARPLGLPRPSDWHHTEEAVVEPEDGGVLVKTRYLSLDPAMRGWMNDAKSYIAPVGLGDVMRAGGIGEVIRSRHPGCAVGDLVSASLGVQSYRNIAAAELKRSGLFRIDPALGTPTQWLNVLGLPGMTAYFGLLDVGQPKPGETLVVSGAAGAVGQTVGQLAKVRGCRVVGIAGGPVKCAWVVNELGFDACVDYKAAAPEGATRWDAVRDGLKQHCPEGVDIYFDNVGGDMLDAVLARIRHQARIVICGAISQYNNTTPVKGPANYLSLLVHRARMEGIVVFDHTERFPQAVAELSGLMQAGRMKSKEDVVVGLENFPDALLKLFKGDNFGKLVLQLA